MYREVSNSWKAEFAEAEDGVHHHLDQLGPLGRPLVGDRAEGLEVLSRRRRGKEEGEQGWKQSAHHGKPRSGGAAHPRPPGGRFYRRSSGRNPGASLLSSRRQEATAPLRKWRNWQTRWI